MVKWTLEFRLIAYECISCVLPWTKFRLIAYECISCVLPWTKFRRRRTWRSEMDTQIQEEEEIKKVSRGVCLKVVEVEARPTPRP